MRKFSLLSSLILSSALSAQILSISSSGQYVLKNGETQDHGIKVATELAKQEAIEQAGTAVVSHFRIERGSDGMDRSTLSASTYAAALIKTKIESKSIEGSLIKVKIIATIDDSKAEEYLKGGPALFDKMSELKTSNDELKNKLSDNLQELQDIDKRYCIALKGEVDQNTITSLRQQLHDKIKDTDKLLQSLGEYQTKTGHLFIAKGSLLQEALKQEISNTAYRLNTSIAINAINKFFKEIPSHIETQIDPDSVRTTTLNGKTTVSFKVSHFPTSEITPYSYLTPSEIKSLDGIKLPYTLSSAINKEGFDKKTHRYYDREFTSLPWGNIIPGKEDVSVFTCGYEPKTIAQCETNFYASSKSLVLEVGIQGTLFKKQIPLSSTHLFGRDLRSKLYYGTKHTLGVVGTSEVTITDISLKDLEKADDLYARIVVKETKELNTNDEHKDLLYAIENRKGSLEWPTYHFDAHKESAPKTQREIKEQQWDTQLQLQKEMNEIHSRYDRVDPPVKNSQPWRHN